MAAITVLGAAGAVGGQVTPLYARELDVSPAPGQADYPTIAAAITFAQATTPSATNRWLIRVHPGIYDETVTMQGFIDVVGVAEPEEVVIRGVSGNLVTFGGEDESVLENVTLRLTAALGGDALVHLATAVNTNIVLRNLILDTTGAAAGNALYAVNSDSAFAHTVTMEGCRGTIVGTGGSFFIREVAGTLTITMRRNNLTMNSAFGFIYGATVTVLTANAEEDHYTGTGGLHSLGAAAHRITLNGGTVDMDAASTNGVGSRATWKTGRARYRVNRSLLIQDALDAADADVPNATAAEPYVVNVDPGTYAEAITGRAAIAVVGSSAGEVIISLADGNLVTLGGIDSFTIKNVTLALTAALNGEALVLLATAVNTNIRLINVIFSPVGAAGANILYAVSSNSAFAHTITLEGCTGTIGGTGGSRFIRESTGTLTATMRRNILTMNNVNGSIYQALATVLTVNAFEDHYSGTGVLMNVGNAAHRVTLNGGSIDMDGADAHGVGSRTVWKTGRQTYRCNASFRIQDAIDAAAADTPTPAAGVPYVVHLDPGVYVEQITMANFVSLVGSGIGKTFIEQTDADVIGTIANQANLQHLTGRVTTPTAARAFVRAAVATSMSILDCEYVQTTPAATQAIFLFCTGAASTITVRRCSCNIGGTGFHLLIQVDTAASTVDLEHCSFISQSVNGVVINMQIAGAVVRARSCHFGDGNPVHINASAGVVRLLNCQYRSITRSVTGVIIDESPEMKTGPYHVVKHLWPSLDNTAQTVTGAGGVVALSGGAAATLKVDEDQVGTARIDQLAEVTSALSDAFTPARCPRGIIQLSTNNFDPVVDMFWGLRQTLGAAVPAATEHHAGFTWNGTNLIATSDDGTASQTTNLTTPTTDVLHTYELIIVGGVQVEFYVDGVLVATHATRVPTNALDWTYLLESAGGGAAADVVNTIKESAYQECPA